MATTQLLQVFLCHASQDKPVVRSVYDRLKKESWINPWLDEIDLLPGQNWKLKIPKAVKESHIVIVFLSKQILTKEGYLQKEIRIALDTALEKPPSTIFIIPLKIEDCDVPEKLSDWQWQNYFGDDEDKNRGYERLLQSLHIRADSVGIKTSYEKEKRQPSSARRSTSPLNKTEQYSPSEISSMFNISKSTLYRWEQEGKLSRVKKNLNGEREYTKNQVKEIAHIQIETLGRQYQRALTEEDIERMRQIHETFSMIKAVYLEDNIGFRELAEYNTLTENTIRQLLLKALTLSVNDTLFRGIIFVLNNQITENSKTD